MRKLLKLGLITTLDHNIGDDFIREGILHAIRRLNVESRLEYVAVNKHEPHTIYPKWHPICRLYPHGYQLNAQQRRKAFHLERLLPQFGFSRVDGCDIIIQCGTPILWQGCRNSEWARLIWRDVLARLARAGKPVLNIGGGSCYALERLPSTLVGDPDEAFARLMLGSAGLTSVRDALAEKLFLSLGYETPHLCCPAVLAAQPFAKPTPPTRKILINYMRGGGHFDLDQGIDAEAWEKTMIDVVKELQRQGWEPLFLAHNTEEMDLAARIWPKAPRIYPRTVLDYFESAKGAAFGVFNRLHASVGLVGMGIPSVTIGTDSRNLMVDTTGQPQFYVKDASFERIMEAVSGFISNRESESQRLLALCDSTMQKYETILAPFIFKGLLDIAPRTKWT